MIVDILQGSLSGIGSLSGDISAVPGISGAISAVSQLSGAILAAGDLSGSLTGAATLGGAITIPPAIGGHVYAGPYEWTPTQETQTINTSGFLLEEDIIINPIPSNYGLITWNGVTLMVS